MSRLEPAEDRPRSARIALVIERFQARGGGVEGVAWQVAHALAGAGERVEVFARVADPTPEVPVRRLAVPRTWQPARVLWFSRTAARATQGFDVVHSFSRTRRQHVYRAGGGCHADYMERAYGPLGARLRRLSPRHAAILAIEEAVFRDPHQLVQCNSQMVSEQIRSRYGLGRERLVVIPNGVDLERFSPARASHDRAPQRAARDTAESAKVFLLLGNGFRRKGLDTALEALARCDVDEAELWVAGHDDPAPWRARAEALGVTGRVRFLGPTDDPGALYAAADALLLPTRYDAFANVCLEAAAAGCPVITSGTNGAAGWLGDACLRVDDPEDAHGFAAAMTAAVDPTLATQLSLAARKRAEASSWDHHIESLRALYARVCAP